MPRGGVGSIGCMSGIGKSPGGGILGGIGCGMTGLGIGIGSITRCGISRGIGCGISGGMGRGMTGIGLIGCGGIVGVLIGPILGGEVPGPGIVGGLGGGRTCSPGGHPILSSGAGRDLLCDNAGTGFSSVPPRNI